MKSTQVRPTRSGSKSNDGLASFVPMSEIRRRVASIKRQWTPDIAKARAVEGQRRRDELELLLNDLLLDDGLDQESGEFDVPAFSVVG